MPEESSNRGFAHQSPETGSPSLPAGHSWLLGIGINDYQAFPGLQNAVRDIQSIAALMQGAFDVAPDKTILLYNEEATREKIIATLDWLVRQVQPEDKLLIYYSGHGHLDTYTEKGYWIPHNAQRDNTAHYIRNSTIRDYIDDIRARHTLLISDSCFSGTLLVRGTSRSGDLLDELESRTSRWVLCSGRNDEEVADGPPGGNSPFTAGILEVLQQHGQNGIQVSKLADQVIEITRANYKQLPEGAPLFGTGHKGGQYVFRRLGASMLRSTQEDKPQPAPVPEAGSLPAVRSGVSFKKIEGDLIFRWVGIGLTYILAVFVLLFLIGAGPISYLLEPLVPVFFFPLPFVATYFVRLSQTTIWILSGAYGLVFFFFTFRWIQTDPQIPGWWFIPLFLFGVTLYYLLLPRINGRKH